MFSTENQINIIKNKLDGVQNKANEINKFLNTILNDKTLEQKKYKELSTYILTLQNKKKRKKICVIQRKTDTALY